MSDWNETKKSVKSWLDKRAEDPLCQGLDFGAYLIMPIQRIPRYKLLLEELIRNTNQNHPDYRDLATALDKLKIVADDVNKSITEQEVRECMVRIAKKFQEYKTFELIKPGRYFVRDGELTKVCRKERKKRHYFLFSDIFLYAFPQQSNSKFKIRWLVDILSLSVRDVPDSTTKKLTNAFEVLSGSKSFIVIAESPKDKEEWIKGLNKVIDEANQIVKTRTNNDLSQSNGGLTSSSSNITAAPIWVPDSEAKSCICCSTKFTFTNRRHHCRQCGNIVCGSCSSNKKELKGQGKVRVCTDCFVRPADWVPTSQALQLSHNELENISSSDSTDDDQGFMNGNIPQDEPNDNPYSSSASELEILYELRALYDYVPSNSECKLSFKAGDTISILQVDDSGWWLGELNGIRAWVPASFLEPIES
eukprot:TRINITY_DN170_c0_g2_i2.p1 TRINITY_DN170_c0_g2~~TRINITY_DN170_c0_g2_i2.p1  ORF type:complete len:419 (-),score=85.91 TRINITY_DN170_c0_g2_i2:115-1371(-)